MAVVAASSWPAWRWYKISAAERAWREGADKPWRLLRDLAESRTARGDRIVMEALTAPESQTRELAAYAVVKAGRFDLADALQAAWRREPQGRTRSVMINFWGRLAGESAEPALHALLDSPDKWTACGAARALLGAGHFAAAERLLMWTEEPDDALRMHVQRELAALAAPMAEMIGQPSPVPDAPAGFWSDGQREVFVGWWRVHVTDRLLRDWFAWRAEVPEMYGRVRYLQHEWDKRFGGFLEVSDERAD